MKRSLPKSLEGALALALLVLAPACATRGTIRELGHPEFEADLPQGQTLTLVEPVSDGELDAFPSGANETADHSSAIVDEVPAHLEGDKLVMSFLIASKNKDIKVDLVQIVVYPLGPKDVIPYRMQGRVPDIEHPVAAFFNSKDKGYVPGSNAALRLEVSVPMAKIGNVDQVAVATLVRFEDGWISIAYRSAPVPKS